MGNPMIHRASIASYIRYGVSHRITPRCRAGLAVGVKDRGNTNSIEARSGALASPYELRMQNREAIGVSEGPEGCHIRSHYVGSNRDSQSIDQLTWRAPWLCAASWKEWRRQPSLAAVQW
jgi:hypothetical protein